MAEAMIPTYKSLTFARDEKTQHRYISAPDYSYTVLEAPNAVPQTHAASQDYDDDFAGIENEIPF
jgi:hypothetical protein